VYSTCLFCSANLGSNEVLESFPVGRRIAFDAARGRLWVVCRTCERWNLSPLEERWEVIDTCEQLFTDTRLRTSTENIGLARLRAGLDLIRIGEPLRPEFAAWRYGDQFGRRRRRAILRAGAGLGAVTLVAAGAFGAGVGLVGMWWGGQGVVRRILNGNPNAIVTTLYDNDERLVRLRRWHLEHVRLIGGDDGGFQLMVRQPRSRKGQHHRLPIVLHGEHARRPAGPVFAAINRFGGSKRTIEHAVTLLEHHPDPAHYVSFLARSRAEDAMPVKDLDDPTRLALEMAVHEDVERRALEGELAELERAWREAEEIAGIADQLLLPENIDERLGRLKE
jgi:hypothetical protein